VHVTKQRNVTHLPPFALQLPVNYVLSATEKTQAEHTAVLGSSTLLPNTFYLRLQYLIYDDLTLCMMM